MSPKAHMLCSAASDTMERVGALADCTLVANGGSGYKLSRGVLAAHSKVLGTIFEDADCTNIRVRLEDSPAELACLVNHCYGGVAFLIDIDNLLDCSRVARKYDMPLLQRMVDAFTEDLELKPENLPDCMTIAPRGPGMEGLFKRCEAFAAKRMQHIINARIREGRDATDWLEIFPPRVICDLMNWRCRMVGALASKWGPKVGCSDQKAVHAMSTEEVVQLERLVKV